MSVGKERMGMIRRDAVRKSFMLWVLAFCVARWQI